MRSLPLDARYAPLFRLPVTWLDFGWRSCHLGASTEVSHSPTDLPESLIVSRAPLSPGSHMGTPEAAPSSPMGPVSSPNLGSPSVIMLASLSPPQDRPACIITIPVSSSSEEIPEHSNGPMITLNLGSPPMSPFVLQSPAEVPRIFVAPQCPLLLPLTDDGIIC